jgi:hypothetical protein
MEGLRQLRDLKWAASLQALVDRPRITTGGSDQLWFAQVYQLHGTVSGCLAPTNIAAPF